MSRFLISVLLSPLIVLIGMGAIAYTVGEYMLEALLEVGDE